MKFFVPGTKPAAGELAYAAMLDALNKQLKWPINPRRIRKLSFTRDKRRHVLEVGQLDNQESHFTVMAIFESSQYIAYTYTPTGKPGVIILVSRDEVTEVEDFEMKPAPVQQDQPA